MDQSKSLPRNALRILSYAELERYARAFADGHLNLLILCGDPGLGKSQCLRRAIGSGACWIGGGATAFGLYLQVYEHRDVPLILDDIDGLYRDRNGVRLLKSLCQTDKEKTLCWHSDAPPRHDAPRQLSTTSQVAIITNEWRSLNADVVALEDRGHVISFEPTALEVHRRAAEWFWDQEVFDFVGDRLHLITSHSLRTYVLACELKQAGLDWRRWVLSRSLTGADLAVAILKADPRYATEEARARAFIASGAGCRATYFNHAKKVQLGGERPAIRLSHSGPPTHSEHPRAPTAPIRGIG